MSKTQREQKLDGELSWLSASAATSPILYPDLPDRSIQRGDWVRAQAVLNAAQFISEFELRMLMRFEMLKWLGCGYDGCFSSETTAKLDEESEQFEEGIDY